MTSLHTPFGAPQTADTPDDLDAWDAWWRRSRTILAAPPTRNEYPGTDDGYETLIGMLTRCRRRATHAPPTTEEPDQPPACRIPTWADRPFNQLTSDPNTDSAYTWMCDLIAGNTNDWLLLQGPRGVGKTSIAATIAHHIDRQAYWPIRRLTEQLIEADRHSQGQALRNQLRDRRLLVIDDVGADRPTDYRLTEVQALLEARYDRECVTVLTTNLDGAELERLLGARVKSRLRHRCRILTFTGDDLRLPVETTPR